MARCFLALSLLVVVGASTEEDLALAADDSCLADPQGESCLLSLRQLRGVKRHGEADIEVEIANASDSGFAGGFCCYSGASTDDVCGTCFETAVAEEGTYCHSQSKCGGCGGTWCKAQCVFSGSDPSDICGTAYDSAIAAEGDFCSKSKNSCASCSGKWCAIKDKEASKPAAPAAPAANVTEAPVAAVAAAPVNTTQAASLAQIAASKGGFCCFSAATKDTCGTCYPTALAKESDYCAAEESCGGCGGTWCTAQCVFSSEDPERPCETAYDSAIASVDDFCGKSKDACTTCKGSWCSKAAKTKAPAAPQEAAPAAPEQVAPPTPPVNASLLQSDDKAGFCCHAGATTGDLCGSCYSTARAEEGTFCASSTSCGGCGGTWCAAQCVFAGEDPNDICGTAYNTAIAAAGDHCSESSRNCEGSCKGKWCYVKPTAVGTQR